MKIYGVASAAYQTKDQTEANAGENTLSITPVVYDSEKLINGSKQGGFDQALTGQQKCTFKIDSKKGIETAVQNFVAIVTEVAKLQKQADAAQKSSIKIPIIFGFSSDFFSKQLKTFADKLASISGVGSSSSRHDHSRVGHYVSNLLRSKNIYNFDLENRIAEMNKEAFARIRGVDLKVMQASNVSEITDELINEIAKSTADSIKSVQFEALLASGIGSNSTFVQIGPPTEKHDYTLPHLKTISENRELRQQVAAAICRELGFHEPFVVKTPFDISSPPFYDVVSRSIALTAAKLDPSLKGKMLGDFVYIPDPCY